MMRDDVKIISSGGVFIDGAGAMAAVFDTFFGDDAFVTFVREPEKVLVGGQTAAESGVWTGKWANKVVRGSYLARWEHRGGWRIAGELFIPLARD